MAAVPKERRRLTVSSCDAAAPSGARNRTQRADLVNELELANPGRRVLSLDSVTDKDLRRRGSFLEKDQQSRNKGSLQDQVKGVRAHGIGLACRKGMKPEAPNQDSFSLLMVQDMWSLYGVFDGHGPCGHEVSDKSRDLLVDYFIKHKDRDTNTTKAFEESFLWTQDALIQTMDSSKVAMSGTTCTMAYHDIVQGTITVAHVGDSRGVIGLQAKAGTYTRTEDLTEDHKPDLPRERARIEGKGGRVEFDGFYNYRVFARAGQYPGLNMSRALGDVVAHNEAGLTAEPDVKVIKLDDYAQQYESLTLFLCSDGVWEFINSDHLPSVVGDLDAQKAAEKLAGESYKRWMLDSQDEVADDITVVLVELKLRG